MSQLWKDEAAFVVSADLVLVSSILVLGLLVGLVSLRDQIVQEFGDVGAAIAVLQQSYSWAGVEGHTASVGGSVWTDTTDLCDEDPDSNTFFEEPLCMNVLVDAEPEVP
jgi:hypothetical protein